MDTWETFSIPYHFNQQVYLPSEIHLRASVCWPNGEFSSLRSFSNVNWLDPGHFSLFFAHPKITVWPGCLLLFPSAVGQNTSPARWLRSGCTCPAWGNVWRLRLLGNSVCPAGFSICKMSWGQGEKQIWSRRSVPVFEQAWSLMPGRGLTPLPRWRHGKKRQSRRGWAQPAETSEINFNQPR